MKPLRRIRKSIIRWLHNIRFQLIGRWQAKRRFVHEGVPSFTQWESSDLVESIVTQKISAADDPRWQESGAISRTEYEQWTWSICGITCLKMYLAYKQWKMHRLLDLAKDCQSFGGYRVEDGVVSALYYQPFVRFVTERFGVRAKAVPIMTTGDIVSALNAGNCVMASVHPSIRFPNQKAVGRGGHLVLIVGYDLDKQEIYLNNPSGFSKESQSYCPVNLKAFEGFFDHKGIVLK